MKGIVKFFRRKKVEPKEGLGKVFFSNEIVALLMAIFLLFAMYFFIGNLTWFIFYLFVLVLLSIFYNWLKFGSLELNRVLAVLILSFGFLLAGNFVLYMYESGKESERLYITYSKFLKNTQENTSFVAVYYKLRFLNDLIDEGGVEFKARLLDKNVYIYLRDIVVMGHGNPRDYKVLVSYYNSLLSKMAVEKWLNNLDRFEVILPVVSASTTGPVAYKQDNLLLSGSYSAGIQKTSKDFNYSNYYDRLGTGGGIISPDEGTQNASTPGGITEKKNSPGNSGVVIIDKKNVTIY